MKPKIETEPEQGLTGRIIRAIENDLNDRRGFHLDDLDEETQADIRTAWEKAIKKVFKEFR